MNSALLKDLEPKLRDAWRDLVAATAGVLALAPIVAATAAAAGIPVQSAVLGAMVGTILVSALSGQRFLSKAPRRVS